MVETSRWQELMDSAYDKWPKDKHMSYEGFLNTLDAKERQAVLLGNFNYQTENGGAAQWVDNGYATRGDDLIEVLELMGSPVASRLAKRLPDLLEYVDTSKKNRGCGDYWLDNDDVPERTLEELTDWFYTVGDQFKEEVEKFISS